MDKKIVFVTHSLSQGGAEKMLSFVANSCVDTFNEVFIISYYKDKFAFKINKRIKLIYLSENFIINNNFVLKISERFILIIKLRKLLKQIKPSLICAFGINNIFISFISSLGLKNKIIGSERRSPENLPFIWRQIASVVYPKCDGMVFQLKEAKSFFNKKTQKMATVIPNPYLSKVDLVPCDYNKREKTITAAAARLEYAKGFDTLIKAFKYVKEQHKEYKLVIYGKGNPEKEYGDLIQSLDLEEDIEFPGLVEDVAMAVYDSSVFVLPSRFEGIPNVLLEVMGVGVPTVSCDCPPGGPRLLTDGGRRGLLVNVDDYNSLGEAICKIIDNENISRHLSIDSLEIKNEFSQDRISNKWTAYFKKIISTE